MEINLLIEFAQPDLTFDSVTAASKSGWGRSKTNFIRGKQLSGPIMLCHPVRFDRSERVLLPFCEPNLSMKN